MNILHTIASLNTRSGGTSTCTYDLVKALNGNGCRTDILTLSPADASDVMIGQDSFIHALPNDAVSPLSLSRGMRGFLHGETEYDLYHTNGLWQDVNHATAAIARAKGKPCVISPHGMLYPEALLRSRWKKRLMLNLGHRRDLERADCIHVTCLREMKHCRALGLLNPMAVIPNPVAVPGFLEELNRPNDRFRIGFLGRFHPIKNIDRLIRAWSVAGKAAQDGELVLVGDGPAEYVSYLRDLARTLHLENVRFTGFLTGRAKFEALASLTALFVPSESENFGMSVPESLLAGTPVMASHGTPWEDLSLHNCGWWRPNDTDTLAQTIEEAAALSGEDLKNMGDAGRRLVLDQYTAPRVAKNMTLLYEYLLRQRPDQPDFLYYQA